MFHKFSSKHYLLMILLLATVLRFVNLTQADVITDESLNAIRSIGLIDYDAAAVQSSPWQWFESVPKWARLSFHDQPILTFLIGHWFFNFFGVSLFVLRLPFVLAGIISVYLLYLIGRRLFNESAGLWAAVLMSLISYPVWIARRGLQESIVICLMLLTVYLFLQALDVRRNLPINVRGSTRGLLDDNGSSDKYWYYWGLTLGLSFLAKYTAFILLPIFILYLLFFRRDIFKVYQFWLGIALAVLIFSPSIIYNLSLYAARGHFDFQLSYLLGQNVAEWPVYFGREKSGGLLDHLRLLLPKLKQGLSWPAFFLLLLSFAASGAVAFKNKSRSLFFVFIACSLIFFWLIIIGAEQRFMTYIVPFLILAGSWLILLLIKWRGKIFVPLVAFWLCFEVFFSVNSVVIYEPKGKMGVTWSPVYYEVKSWGFNELNAYLGKLLDNNIPALALPARYEFLEEIKKNYLQKNKNKDAKPYLLVYDANMDDLAALWLIHRRVIYQGWPILDAATYLDILEQQGADFFFQQGVRETYFIKATDKVLLENDEAAEQAAENLASQMKPENLKDEIKNKRGEVVFRVYRY